MSATDEIEALDRSIRDTNQQILQKKNQLIALRQQLKNAEEAHKKARINAQSAERLMKRVKGSDVVNLLQYHDVRVLYHRNIDAASARGVDVLKLQGTIEKAEREIPAMEAALTTLISNRKRYGVVEQIR